MSSNQKIQNLQFEIDLITTQKNKIKEIKNPSEADLEAYRKLAIQKVELEDKLEKLLLNSNTN